jgi:DNA ligase D-like protein (predicted 3'-phosphoesterase)
MPPKKKTTTPKQRLTRYRAKRDFTKTPEPTGGKSAQKSLAYCIQKHLASHLHYDFRLEHKGVLLSWAVPKGPSLRPADKRLAMRVEDHPFDYRTFEGVIPSGYGAGVVMLWDEGTLTASNSKAVGCWCAQVKRWPPANANGGCSSSTKTIGLAMWMSQKSPRRASRAKRILRG